MSRCVDLDERVTAQFYDQECEEWTMQTVTIEDVLDSVCDEYTVLPSAQPEERTEKRTETHACDSISRKAAISTAQTMCERCDTGDVIDYRDMMVESLKVLPSAQPERKKGRWSGARCSVCGVSRYNFINILHTNAGYRGTWKFCPNCGADMRGGQNG